jgi:ATP-dependent Clp protease protease subunit
MEKYKNRMIDILCENGATKTRAEIIQDMDRDYWMEANEAIEYGLADKIVTPEIWESWIKEE